MAFKVLILGGNRFVGHLLTYRLLAQGHTVTQLNRGSIPNSFGARVEHLRGDRTTDLAKLVGNREFDAVIDFTCFTGADAQASVEVFAGRTGHHVMISTGQVYLVRATSHMMDGLLPASKETDYLGPIMSAPPTPADQKDWEYGVWKRDAEDCLAAHPELPSTRLRIPMVNGPRDYYRRIESYLLRLLDGQPLLIPTNSGGPQRICRHVYGQDVAVQIAGMLGAQHAMGKAYNLAQPETPTLLHVLYKLADLLGTELRYQTVTPEKLAVAGLTPKQVSPFSDPWMSYIDPTLAFKELGWCSTPFESQLATIVESFLSYRQPEPPLSYTHRARELKLL